MSACLLGWAAPCGSAPPPGQPDDAVTPPPSDQAIAEGLFRATARLTAPRKRDPACDSGSGKSEIVVCGADRGERWRVPSTTTSDPTSREAQNTGIARAPNVSALPDCSRGCLHLGRAPGQVLTIDAKAIPKAPAGSDADRIARGEMAER